MNGLFLYSRKPQAGTAAALFFHDLYSLFPVP
jgi:hypothetical protein